MSIAIIASSFEGIAQFLASLGYEDISEITFTRQLIRINGTWHTEIRHGK